TDQRGGIFTNDPARRVDNHDRAALKPVRWVDSRHWLADDVPSRRVCVKSMDFGQDGIDNLELKSSFQTIEVVGPPGVDCGVVDRAQDVASEHGVREDGRYLQQRVLHGAAMFWIRTAYERVSFEQRHQRVAKNVFHARTPVAIAPLTL